MKDKYLWYTDTHLDKVLPWKLIKFVGHALNERPKGIFLTGDISTGIITPQHLALLAKLVKCPIYFVLGNHDYHFTSIEKVHEKVRRLCKKYPNLIWLTDAKPVPLSSEVGLIGTEGWYDAQLGNPKLLWATIDWVLTKEFRQLSGMEERLKFFRQLSEQSCDIIADKLQDALSQGYKTIYLLTHFPPWEAVSYVESPWLKSYFLAYNINVRLGQTIEKIMKGHNNKHLIVLAGHTHTDCWIHIARNIECKVNGAKFYGFVRNEERIFI